MEKKKPNVIIYTILMCILFLFITEGIIWGYGGRLIYSVIASLPQGHLVISEAVLAVMVLIVMLIFKNSYVFTQKKEKLSTSLFYGLFDIICASLFTLLFGLIGGGLFSGLALINIFIGCILVGICEEFLCRGWLLNEFLERFGDTTKGVWYSIIISGIIFGLMHIGNIFTVGQSVISTIGQVFNAAGAGIFYGVIYYKTKNIWSVIFLHAFWDFSLFLGDLAPVTELIESHQTISIISLIFTILIVLAQLINIIPYLKNIHNKPKKSVIIYLAILSTFLYIVFTFTMSALTTQSGDKYTFGSLHLDNYAITRDNYSEYNMYYTNSDVYSFKLNKTNKNNLLITNLNTESSIEIECEQLIDYLILEQDKYYILSYLDYTESQNYFLNYIYLPKEEISNEDEYLDHIKNDMKKYLVKDSSELVIVSDYTNHISYISSYDVDSGYYVLTSEDNVSILNRD